MGCLETFIRPCCTWGPICGSVTDIVETKLITQVTWACYASGPEALAILCVIRSKITAALLIFLPLRRRPKWPKPSRQYTFVFVYDDILYSRMVKLLVALIFYHNVSCSVAQIVRGIIFLSFCQCHSCLFVPKCLTSKYTNTNTQLHEYSLSQIIRYT